MGLTLYFLVPMKAARKMMILMMKEYISSWGELKFSVFISTSAADASSPTTACRVLLIFQKEFADGEHQDERRQHYGESGYARPKHSHARAVLFGYRGIAYIGCRIDADRTGSHLADCYDVGKLLRCEPAVTGDYLTLYHGQHGVSAAKTEQADFKECVE